MATKIFALLVLLALSVSTAIAFFSPQCSFAPTNAIIPELVSPLSTVGFEHPIVRAFRLQQALAASNLQQPIAQLQQQSSTNLIVQTIAAQLQQQQFLPVFSQLTLANPAVYFQQHQLLPINPLAAANAIAYLQRYQQQLQQFVPALSQLAMARPAAYFQQQQLFPSNQLAVPNTVAFLQQQQSLPFIQLALANAAVQNQLKQVLSLNPFAVANPLAAAFLQQQQSQPFNQMSFMNPALSWQQPIVGGAIF